MDEELVEIEAVEKEVGDPVVTDTDNIEPEENDEDMSKLKDVVTEVAAQGAKLLVAWIWARLGRKKE